MSRRTPALSSTISRLMVWRDFGIAHIGERSWLSGMSAIRSVLLIKDCKRVAGMSRDGTGRLDPDCRLRVARQIGFKTMAPHGRGG